MSICSIFTADQDGDSSCGQKIVRIEFYEQGADESGTRVGTPHLLALRLPLLLESIQDRDRVGPFGIIDVLSLLRC